MRSVICYGPRDYRLEEIPTPQVGPGEVLVRVRAVSLNFRDIAILRGRYPRRSVPGLVPVSDAAGEVVAVGEDVHAFKVGDRVLGAFHPRWFGGHVPSTILRDCCPMAWSRAAMCPSGARNAP